MLISEVMTRGAVVCYAHETMAVAARLMWEHDIGAVPVLDDAKKLVGIVTDRDLCMAAYITGGPLAAVPVTHAMSRVVFTVEPGQRLEAAEELMRSKRVRRVPVVERAQVVGMITLGDLSRAALARRTIPAPEVNAILAAVVEPRTTSVPAAA